MLWWVLCIHPSQPDNQVIINKHVIYKFQLLKGLNKQIMNEKRQKNIKYLFAKSLLDKSGNLSVVQIQSNQTALPTLSKQHVGFHNQFGRRKPRLIVR